MVPCGPSETVLPLLRALGWVASQDLPLPRLHLFVIGIGAISTVAAVGLYVTRRQPSERYALAR